MGWPSLAQRRNADSLTHRRRVQHNSVSKDSTASDSSSVYKGIKNYSERSKVTELLHHWLFRSPGSQPDTLKPDTPQSDYGPYGGKIIRDIHIKSHGPFGFSFKDSTKTAHSWLQKTGNSAHINTKDMAIRDFILVESGEPLDTLKIRETARLLRDQHYIRDVRIIPQSIDKKGDSVDLDIEVLDSWSIIPRVSVSNSKMRLGLNERNFIGTGHQVDLYYSNRFDDGDLGFEADYRIPNFKNTFIEINGKYRVEFDHHYDKFLSINRDFYSPFARWAGGAFYQNRSIDRPFAGDSLGFNRHDLKFTYQDYWGALAFPVFKGDSPKDRTTNLIVGLRASLLNYRKRPAEKYDPEQYFSNEQFYLGSVGLSSRQFVRDSYIFRDGETEDVPVGSVYSLTGGVQHKNHHNRMYWGLRASYGAYFDFGFLSGNVEMGSFFRSGMEQSAISLQANYFSPLMKLGKSWRLRQFAKPSFVLGFNRLPSKADRLNLNYDPYFNGVHRGHYTDVNTGYIHGFRSPARGQRKYVIDLQTQFYSPWEIFGFHLNPFLDVNLAYLGGKNGGYGSDQFYSSFGVGFMVRNDFLVFDLFQISLSFYPSMPNRGQNVIKYNGFRNEDFGFQSFKSSKPRPVVYQ